MQEILTSDVISVVNWCVKEFHQPISGDIESAEDMKNIAKQLFEISNKYSYLSSILSYLKYYIREAKGKDKELASTLIDKKEAINNALECIKTKYNALSRQVTIRQDIMRELSMTSAM